MHLEVKGQLYEVDFLHAHLREFQKSNFGHQTWLAQQEPLPSEQSAGLINFIWSWWIVCVYINMYMQSYMNATFETETFSEAGVCCVSWSGWPASLCDLPVSTHAPAAPALELQQISAYVHSIG